MKDDVIVTRSGKPEVLGPDPEVVELTKAILRQHDMIIKANVEILPRLVGAPIVYCPKTPTKEK